MSQRESATLPSLERETLEVKAYRALRQAILDGTFGDGHRLVQDQLAESLGVSRIPVRDALKRLAADGLVTVDERGAYFARRFTPDDTREVYGLRMLLEPYAVTLAVERMTDEDEEELARIAESLLEAGERGERDAYVERNRTFHMALYGLARQRRLLRLIVWLWSGMPSLTPILIEEQFERSNREHRAIMDAVRERDAAAAAELLRAHIANAGEALVDRLEGNGGA